MKFRLGSTSIRTRLFVAYIGILLIGFALLTMVALMLVGAALLYQAIARRSQGLRRIAMAVIALTIAKVFLIDASGLTGLTRVFSFLALGLSLAGLAWLNRWAAGQGGDQGKG